MTDQEMDVRERKAFPDLNNSNPLNFHGFSVSMRPTDYIVGGE